MLELADRFEFRVRWEPFLLRPDTPPEGRPKPAGFSDPNNKSVQNLKQAGAAVGIDFTFKCGMVPNTLKSHALLEFARGKDNGAKQNDIAEQLFQAYFTDGKILNDDVLLSVAEGAGFSKEEVKKYINEEKILNAMAEKARSWLGKNVTGVPFFYMNGHRMFSGAQDVEVFKKMFETASDKFPLNPSSRS